MDQNATHKDVGTVNSKNSIGKSDDGGTEAVACQSGSWGRRGVGGPHKNGP